MNLKGNEMKKQELIEMGLTEELAVKVEEASKTELVGYIPKKRFDEVNLTKKQLEEDIKTRDTQLETLKGSTENTEALKKTIEDLQEANNTATENYNKTLKQIKIDNAVEKALMENGAINMTATKPFLKDLNEFNEDGTIQGLKAQIETLKENENTKFLFGNKVTGITPNESSDKVTEKNPWSKENFNLTEQGRILREDPELAKQLKGAHK